MSAARPRQIHLDTDMGGDPDDLCALAYLLRAPGVELMGVTTNLELGGTRAGYVRRVLELEERHEVPVAAGDRVGSGHNRLPVGLPDAARYWGDTIPPLNTPPEAAVELLERSIGRGAMVVAIGAYTNLALLEERRPGILATTELVLMGGCVRRTPRGFPDWGPEGDWNVNVDSESARRVLEAAAPGRLTLVPIEITMQTAITRSQLPALRRAGRLGELIARQAEMAGEDYKVEQQYRQTCARLPEGTLNFQHDPLACAVALGWDGATVETLRLAWDLTPEGALRLREEPSGKSVRVVTAVDGLRFGEHWLETVAGVANATRAANRRAAAGRSASGCGSLRRGASGGS